MKKFLGFCLVGLNMFSAWGAGAPLILDWGVVDTSSAVQQKRSQAVRTSGHVVTVQSLSAQGTAPWLVQFDDVIQEEWKTALEAVGAKLKGYMPENGLLLQATPKQIAAIAALDHVAYVGEFLPEYKRAAKVRTKLARVAAAAEHDIASAYRILVFSDGDLDAVVQKIEALPSAAVTSANGNRIRADLTATQVAEITGWGEVQWVEPYTPPRLWNNIATQTNMMNVSNVWTDAELGLTGRGQIVAVADTGLDSGNTNTLHPDFTNRVTGFGWSNGVYSASYSWADLDEHGTHVCGSVLGNGTKSSGLYKGPAYEANLIMQGMQADLSGLDNAAAVFKQAFTNGARIHSDSWGYGDAGLYNADSRVVDQFVWSNKTMLIVIAAGNDGEDLVTPYGVIDPGSVASPSTAKNCLTVGASENYRTTGGYAADTWGTGSWTSYYPRVPISNDYISRPFSNNIQGLAGFSGRGPCNDGRIKPDIVAPGTDIISTRTRAVAATGWGTVSGNTNYIYMGGTSMATPLTAGAAVLARQWLVEKAGFTNPSAALMKALLINGARDMTPGQYGTGPYKEITARPDNAQGFGHVNLYNTLKPATNQFLDLYDTNSLSTGQTNTFPLTVSATSTNKFILTMAYADYWGTASSGKQLVNDLDLTVQKPSGTTLYANGRTSKDATNNVELIEFAADEAGTYTVRVSARTVSYGSPQDYALVVRGPKADETPTAPVFGANPGPLTATVGELMDFTVMTTAGYPTPVLALESTTATLGYYDIEAGYCVYQPPAADVGTNTFTFTASNASGSVTQTVTVVVSAGPPSAPASIWASATNSTDFTAAWSEVAEATSYRLDVATNATFSGGGGAGETLLSEGFDNGMSAPVGWLFTTIGGTYTSIGNFGAASPSLKLDATGDAVQTPALSGPTNVSFWIKGQTSTGSSLLLEAAAGGSWSAITNITTLLNTATTYSCPLGTSVTNLRFTYTKVTSNVAFDDVLVTGGASAPSYVPGYSNRTVASTSESVTGLSSGATYYFRARAVNGGGTSPNSPTASVTTTVSAVAPTFGANPGPVATTAGVVKVFAVSASGVPAPTLALTAQTATSGYSFVPATGVLTYTPPQADAGNKTFTFSASNSQGVAYQTVTAAVTAATLPGFTSGAGPYSTTAGVAVAFTVSASGTPAATLALQSQTASSGFGFNPATGAFTYTPPVGDVGAPTFTFTASNAAGVVAQTTTVNVAAMATVPDAPASVWASATNSSGFTAAWSSVSGAMGYRLDVGTNNTFTGGGGAGSQSVLASNEATVTSITNNGWTAVDISGTSYAQMLKSTSAVTSPAFSTAGFTNLTVDVKARTYGGASGSSSNITVSISTNDGSSWTSIGVVAPGSTTLSAMPTLANTANLGNSQTRIRWQTLGADGTKGVGVSNLVIQGWSSGSSAPSYVPGYSNLTVSGTNQAVTGLTASATYYFRARAVNAVGTGSYSSVASVTTTSNAPAGTPPVMDAVASQAALTGRDVVFAVTATPTDGDPILSYACTSAVDPDTWDFDTGTGDFLFIPTVVQIGANVFSFTATDKDGASAPVAMTVTVSAASAPTVNTIEPQSTYVGATFEYTATATEPDGDAVTFACTSAVDEGTWIVETNGYFLFGPTAAQVGPNVFSFTATDRDGTSAPVPMSVKVYSAAASNAFTQWVEDQQENPASSNFWENADYDGDGQTTYQEYLADTDPASSNSVLKMEGLSNDLKWFSFPASPARYYQLEYCTDITNQATVAVSNLGWGVPGLVVTNDSTGTWYGVIRALLQAP